VGIRKGGFDKKKIEIKRRVILRFRWKMAGQEGLEPPTS
jgi:hypothetical protein